MRLGLALFIIIITLLAVVELSIIKAIGEHTVKRLESVQHMPTRYDFRDGKQILLHSGTGTYTQEYYYPAPPSRRTVTPEEHRRAWIQFWAEQEGHEPWE